MKGLFIFLAFTLVFSSSVFSGDFLVSVELNEKEKIMSWIALGFPAYEFIDNKAFSFLDEIEIEKADDAGLKIQVLDENPFNKTYVFVPANLIKETGGLDILFENESYILADITLRGALDLYMRRIPQRGMSKIPIPERFWSRLLRTTIFMDNLQWDPVIQSIVDQVDTDSITSYIQRLQDFRTRFLLTDSSYAASQWLRQKFQSWGYQTAFDSFWVSTSWPGSGWERNVVATSMGSMIPQRHLIICGHFDAIVWTDTSWASIFAPGADDNATGTAAALEAARVFSGFSPEKTVNFIGWAAEERGLFGSYHYAETAHAESADILAVLNYDMIGYRDDSYLDNNIQRKDAISEWLSSFYYSVSDLYAPNLVNFEILSSGGSDWYPFAQYGYSSIGMMEADQTHYNPHYHDTSDVISTLDPQLYTVIIKSGVAALAVLSFYPSPLENVAAYDLGDGTSALILWDQPTETDISGYKIYLGDASQTYQDTFSVAGAGTTFDTLENLETGEKYYVSVTAVDFDDRESYLAYETDFICNDIPMAPSGISALPVTDGIIVQWKPNLELDLGGYRIYRGVNQDTLLDSLNTALMADTFFSDLPLSGADRYYYSVRAFDTDGNASSFSEIAYGRPLTLDQGILLVNETQSSGSFPPDSTVNAFYLRILEGYKKTGYRYSSLSEKPAFSDFAPYSTVVWHTEDLNSFYADDDADEIKQYLENGGNLWITGWKTTANLSGLTSYPINFPQGNIVNDFLKITSSDLSKTSDSFQGTAGNLSYPSLSVDPSKIPVSAWGQTLRYIESYTASGAGEVIYTIDMSNNSSPYEGQPCAVRYLGPVYKAVVFGFPLYYINESQARAAAQKVMSDFGETVSVEEIPLPVIVPSVAVLYAVPNIFSAETYIYYFVPQDCRASLKVYNAAGQLVATLFEGDLSSGVFRTFWDAKDERNNPVKGGVYFARLSAGDQSLTVKMTLTR